MMGMGFGFGLILMILFWILVVGLAVWLLSSIFPRTNDTSRTTKGNLPNSPLEIIQERYARGEITKTEYDEMISVLQNEMR
jgi:putative membrane protein